MEKWKDIQGFEGLYQVSDLGRVKSLRSNKVLKECFDAQLYPFVNLYGIRKRVARIHRLVAESFLPADHFRNEVNHKDGNKSNNRVINLEWSTRLENQRHAKSNGLNAIGEKHGNSKLNESIVIRMRRMKKDGLSYRNISEALNIPVSTIKQVVLRINWRHVA